MERTMAMNSFMWAKVDTGKTYQVSGLEEGYNAVVIGDGGLVTQAPPIHTR